MAQKILGLDISDELLSAVMLGQGRGERRILARGVVVAGEGEWTGDDLARLLDQVGWQGGTCVCGLSLADLSLRNLALPFRDRRRIGQILPFELEDQLVVPVGEQVVEYLRTGGDDAGSNLLVFCLEKRILAERLDLLAAAGIEPRRVVPAMLALAGQAAGREGGEETLLLHAGLHSLSMAICRAGRPVFLRRLPYPEEMFTRPPFALQDLEVRITDRQQAADCIRAIRREVQRSQDFFRMEVGGDTEPDRVFLSGALATAPEVVRLVGEAFGREITLLDLRRAEDLQDPGGEVPWRSGLFDRALALALSGLERRASVDFRQGEFAAAHGLFSSRRRIVAALALSGLLAAGWLGWLWADCRGLDARYQELGAQMRSLYRQSFPGATRIIDPLAQMKANLRQMQAPRVSLPLFTGRKRILDILADISARVPKSVTIHVSRLVIDDASVQIKGTTDTFNNVDTIKNRLVASPLYREVKIVSATAGKKKGEIRFEIRLQLGGAS
ncbi:MAG TPA: hypothetical protein ENK27_06515 [Desulfobulbus sp.]|nr:hypothetical protein [Desulfobulbus sp.]